MWGRSEGDAGGGVKVDIHVNLWSVWSVVLPNLRMSQ